MWVNRLLVVCPSSSPRLQCHPNQQHEICSSQSIYALLRYIFYIMSLFEFDLAKSDANLVKHGIDFVEAQALWGDPMLLEIPARTADEPRFLVIGLIEGKHWSAVITYRGVNIRLISVRRARTEEVALYEG
jgi:uncharacterized DUF497 family protein